MTDNLALWNTVERTPQEHTKAITGKSYSGTSPKPHYLVRKATETFGPCGIGWGFDIVNERIEEGSPGEKMHIALVRVWYKWNGERGEVQHVGGTPFSGVRSSGKTFIDEDAPKKSVTDALVKALSMIGFAGDIFMGRYDDSKYIAELKEEARAAKEAPRQSAPAPKTDPIDPAESEQTREVLIHAMGLAEGLADLTDWANDGKNQKAIAGLLPKDQDLVRQSFRVLKHGFEQAQKGAAA